MATGARVIRQRRECGRWPDTSSTARRIVAGLLLALPVLALRPPAAAQVQPPDAAAAGLLERALRDDDRAAAVQAGLELAARYQARKEPGRAEAVLREMARRYPGTRPSEVCFELGYLLFGRSEWRPEALRWLRRAVAAGKPRAKAAQAQLFASYVYGEWGDQRQAEAEFERLRKLFPEDRRRAAQAAMDSVFFRYWQSPDPEGLLREAQQVHREYGDYRDIAGALDMVSARILMSLGRPGEALPLLEQVPPDLSFPAAMKADALGVSILCHLQLGSTEKAQVALAELARQSHSAVKQNELARLAELVARCTPGGAHASLRVVVTDPTDGGPVAGALVRVWADLGVVIQRYTDAQGTVLFDHLLPGDVSFWVSVGGQPVEQVKGVTLTAGTDATVAVAKARRALPELAKARVRLVAPGGKPAADADVQAWGLFPALLHSDAEGAVALPDIWRIAANAQRTILVSVADVGTARVDAAAVRDGTVQLRPGATIEGTVVAGADQKPAFGAPVCAALLAGTSHTVAGLDGTFRLDTLPPGEYTLGPSASRPAPGDRNARTLTLREGETVKDVRLTLDTW